MVTQKHRRHAAAEVSKEHSAPPSNSNRHLLSESARKRQNLPSLILMGLGVTATLRLFFHELKCAEDSTALQNLGNALAETFAPPRIVVQHQQQSSSSCLAPLPPIRTRGDMVRHLQQWNFTSGIEIGVQLGLFAEYNLKSWPACQTYKLIDLWQQQVNYKDAANVENSVHESFFQQTKERLQPFEKITQYYRMYSNEAAKIIAEEGQQVDFVYVDARHDYCGCKEDIELYWPLIKPGGILAGHDFMENYEVAPQDWSICMDGSIHPEAVKGAVMEFANKHKLPVGVTYRETMWNSWWIRKPLC
ncbi:expressed unknown protein [Seminavis robusta]|uniref:Methyltransferase n=1 Tax=Seminavis robusta TaxID=568900 RepID=A0A9N8DHC3_9STRA|nr:expressed unknown protein [Seminavis robusta]|eukprot:Sro85_g045460.1 n/a (304) ;mRNA; r:88794-89705